MLSHRGECRVGIRDEFLNKRRVFAAGLPLNAAGHIDAIPICDSTRAAELATCVGIQQHRVWDAACRSASGQMLGERRQSGCTTAVRTHDGQLEIQPCRKPSRFIAV
jgi:hypothetical protein